MAKSQGEDEIIRSPLAELVRDLKIPEVSLAKFLFQSMRMNHEAHGDKALVVDAVRDQSISFKEFEPLSKQFASALTRIGFGKGDVLLYMTYNAALMYVLHFGTWLCRGATRGYYQREQKEEVERIMRESRSRFALCERETYNTMKWAADRMEWPVTLLSIDGHVEGTMAVEDMVYKDDGSAYKEVDVDPKEDVVYIPSTNGSTGLPKGTLITNYAYVAQLAGMGLPQQLTKEMKQKKILSTLTNFTSAPFLTFLTCIMRNYTFISISQFVETDFFKYVEKYKPDTLLLFPYVANWFALTPELLKHDLSSIKEIMVTGAVFHHATLSVLSRNVPAAEIYVVYGSTEASFVSSQNFGQHHTWDGEGVKSSFRVKELEKFIHVSCGFLLPLVEAKILDIDTKESLGKGRKGKLLLRSPYFFKGYLQGSGKELKKDMDDDGWFDTGDVAFFDEEGYLYIVDRLKSVFKYKMHHVSPSDIEGVIAKIPAVATVGVVGVPDAETTSAARAYVVVKPGSEITEQEIMDHVAAHTPSYKHLHGGVLFVDKLPETRGGKVDRNSLLKRAMEETSKETKT